MLDAYYLSIENPAQLGRALDKASRSMGENKAPVYLRKKGDQLVAKSTSSALFWTQARRTLYSRIPDYLLGCALKQTQAIEKGLDPKVAVHLRMVHPCYRAVGHEDHRYYAHMPELFPSQTLVGALKALHRRDWLCLPGTDAAYASAQAAIEQCNRYYDLAEGSQHLLMRAGVLSPTKYFDSEGAQRIAAEARQCLAELRSLQPANGDDFGPFHELAQRVYQFSEHILHNFIILQHEHALDEACRQRLSPLGLADGESISFWLHRLWSRGEWIAAAISDPTWLERVDSSLAAWPAQGAMSDAQQLRQLLVRIRELGQILLTRRSPIMQRICQMLDSELGCSPLAPGEQDSLCRVILAALNPVPEPCAPPMQEQCLLLPGDHQNWQTYEQRPPYSAMTKLLMRPRAEIITLPDASQLDTPCYASWSTEHLKLVQDQVLAALICWRLERSGHTELADQLWLARADQTRLSRITWSADPDCASPLKACLLELACQIDAARRPSWQRLGDEVRTAIGGLAQREYRQSQATKTAIF